MSGMLRRDWKGGMGLLLAFADFQEDWVRGVLGGIADFLGKMEEVTDFEVGDEICGFQ